MNDVSERIAALSKFAEDHGQQQTPFEKIQLSQKLAETEYPVWIDQGTKQINEPLLCGYIADYYHLRKKGNRIFKWENQPTTKSELQRFISDEVAKFCPTRAWSKVNSVFKLLLNYIPEEQADTSFHPFTAASLADEVIPDTPFVVEGLLPAGLTIFAAPPKIGKSWLCLALAEAVATGDTFWGHKTRKGSCLYLALEDSKKRLQTRLTAMRSRFPEQLFVETRTVLTLDSGLIDKLDQWITNNPDTRLIILDTLQRVKGSQAFGQDAYASDYARMTPLQQLAIDKGVSILAVHHFRKQGNVAVDDVFERVSGSTALFGASDCTWAISGKRGADEMKFNVTGRDVEENEYKIGFDKEKMRWVLLGNSEELEAQRKRDEYNTSPLVLTIRELVAESRGRWIGSASELSSEVMKRYAKVPATSDKALRHLLDGFRDDLLTLDKIAFTQAKGGRYGRGYTFETVRQQTLL